MRIRLAYGKQGLTVDLPDEAQTTVVEPRYVAPLPDAPAGLRDALRAPINAPALSDWVKPGDSVAIVFSDITRPTPNHILLPAIVDELRHVPDAQITLFNSTGTHRANTDAELRQMLGDDLVNRFEIVQNDAADDASHVEIGTTASGNAIRLHRRFVDTDKHILTGFIEPHFFAGFSGGGKATMPGLAALETIMHNHRPANMDDTRARWGITEGNPLWEDVREAAHMVPHNFLVNVTLNRDKQITGVFAGELDTAHAAGCTFVKQTAMVPVPERFDIVLTSNSGYPLDLNLYQSVKGMSAAAQVVKPGGTIIIATECWDGIPDHGEYGRMLREAGSTEGVLKMVRVPGFRRQDMWQAQIQSLVAEQAAIYVYSDYLTDDQLQQALLTPCDDVSALVAKLLAQSDRPLSLCVLPEGPQTIPYVAEHVPDAPV